jgi:AraC-like DNA-binding protein
MSKQNPNIPMYLHKHTFIELDYVYRGSCSYFIGTADNVFQLREKEICIINQNAVHGIRLNAKDDIVLKCFIPFGNIDIGYFERQEQDPLLLRFLISTLSNNTEYSSFLVIRPVDFYTVDEIMLHMYTESIDKSRGWKQVIDSYINILLTSLMRSDENECRFVSEPINDHFQIDKIISRIENNYKHISLKELAKNLHFHENYLSRMIKKSTNYNFSELLCQVRLNEAAKLLLHTDLKISEIADSIGYSKPNYFYKLFKEHYGITPTEYKSARRT